MKSCAEAAVTGSAVPSPPQKKTAGAEKIVRHTRESSFFLPRIK